MLVVFVFWELFFVFVYLSVCSVSRLLVVSLVFVF